MKKLGGLQKDIPHNWLPMSDPVRAEQIRKIRHGNDRQAANRFIPHSPAHICQLARVAKHTNLGNQGAAWTFNSRNDRKICAPDT